MDSVKVAKVKVWKTLEGKLVPDLHPEAAVLLAVEGQRVESSKLEEMENVSKFFDDVNTAPKAAKVEPKAETPAEPAQKPAAIVTEKPISEGKPKATKAPKAKAKK